MEYHYQISVHYGAPNAKRTDYLFIALHFSKVHSSAIHSHGCVQQPSTTQYMVICSSEDVALLSV